MSAVMERPRSIADNLSIGGVINVDRRRRRFGYAPGIHMMAIDPINSGIQAWVIPQGQLIPFKTATLMAENFKIDEDPFLKQKPKDFEAAWFIDNVKQWYGEQGFIELDCLTPLEDDEAYASFDAIDSPIVCKHWEGGLTAGAIECVTCRIRILEGEEIKGRMRAAVARSGKGEVKLSFEVLDDLREARLASCYVYRDYCITRWQDITGELDVRKSTGNFGLPTLKAGEHHIRKHLHQAEPANRPAEAAAAYGHEQAVAMAEALDKQSRGFGEAISTLVKELKADKGESEQILREQNELLMKRLDAIEQAQSKEEKAK